MKKWLGVFVDNFNRNNKFVLTFCELSNKEFDVNIIAEAINLTPEDIVKNYGAVIQKRYSFQGEFHFKTYADALKVIRDFQQNLLQN